MSTCLKHSAVVGCWNKADTTKENVVIHYTYATNASGVEILKATRYTTSNGTPISLGVGESVTPGSCQVSQLNLISGGVSIANGTFATNLGPDGTSWTNPGNLKSVTIRARRSNTTNANSGAITNGVVVATTDNKIVLLTNEIITFSVEDGNIQLFESVDTIGNAAALVTYNRI